jgi:anti-sigma factor RsiW
MRCPIEADPAIVLADAAGRLDADRAAMLREHTKQCRACRESLDRQRAVWEALDVFEAAPVPPDFDRRLYARIATQKSAFDRMVQPLRLLFGGPGLRVAAASAVALLAVLLLHQSPGPASISAVPESAEVEAVPPEQAEGALQQMELVRQLTQVVQSDSAQPKM